MTRNPSHDDRNPPSSRNIRSPITPVSARSPPTARKDWPTSVPTSSANNVYKEEALTAADITEEHRVFIENRQRFCLVKIGASTRARDVLALVAAKNELHGTSSDDRSEGGWMVYEMANDFGMERPIRDYEMIADIFASWNQDMRLNTLMVKKTSLRAPLSFKNMPSSSPTHEGMIYWEGKKGKWSKRHLRLREHCLFLSKKDSGKDETLLCSLSNFDAYTMSRVYRSPKPFTFALRSTDNLSMFENPSDSFHIFSCDKSEGEIWTQKVMLARSYVLLKERTILFQNPQQPPPYTHIMTPPASGGRAAPSRSMGAHKSTGTLRRPATSDGRPRPPLALRSSHFFQNYTIRRGVPVS
ncbi:hypothetical protein BS47DRAFT_1434494 [Hydnum rufescens UP504]|uniref:PH domain-containing protein n=1 Tax=Hydnum rufescens UP504 TaxID=1448309 RepID=A0A9P6B4E1_9AGAM|nr:hypothetical protein BS47DRAFT_1434494 [Hydnum rufescens UP504]